MNYPFKSIDEYMADWHKANQFPFNPHLWLMLIEEEYKELRGAVILKTVEQEKPGEYLSEADWTNNARDGDVLAELADLAIVTIGMILNMGYNPSAVIGMKHMSNMSKFCWSEESVQETVDFYASQGKETDVRKVDNHYVVFDKATGKTLKSTLFLKLREEDFLNCKTQQP